MFNVFTLAGSFCISAKIDLTVNLAKGQVWFITAFAMKNKFSQGVLARVSSSQLSLLNSAPAAFSLLTNNNFLGLNRIWKFRSWNLIT